MKHIFPLAVFIFILAGIFALFVWGWDALTAILLGGLALFGLGVKPTKKVEKKVEKEMDKIDESDDPHAHGRNIGKQLRIRRIRKIR